MTKRRIFPKLFLFSRAGEKWKNLNLHISIYPCSVEKEIFSTFFYFSISLKIWSVGWPEGTLTNLILTYVHPQCSHMGSVDAVHVSLVGEQPLQYLHECQMQSEQLYHTTHFLSL